MKHTVTIILSEMPLALTGCLYRAGTAYQFEAELAAVTLKPSEVAGRYLFRLMAFDKM